MISDVVLDGTAPNRPWPDSQSAHVANWQSGSLKSSVNGGSNPSVRTKDRKVKFWNQWIANPLLSGGTPERSSKFCSEACVSRGPRLLKRDGVPLEMELD